MTVFPPLADVEALMVALLAAAGVTAGTRVPNPRSDGMVRVGRVGGARVSGISDRPNVLIECWDADSVTAAALAMKCHDALFAARNQTFQGWQVKDVEASGPVYYDDPAAPDMARYQFTASLLLRLT